MGRNDKKIVFLGAGKMALALIGALINKSGVKAVNLTATDISPLRRKIISRKYKGIKTSSDNAASVKSADIVFLCVKPKDFENLLTEISPSINPSRHIIVSIAAGITLNYIENRLPTGARVIRTMPNTPISVGEGVVFVVGGKSAKAKDIDFISKLFEPSALVVKLENEKMINSATAISGSGPAYVYYFAEALIEAAVNFGFSRSEASRIVIKTFIGAAKMMSDGLKANVEPAELRKDVTSPGGTTFEAINFFEKSHLINTVLRAVQSAKRKAYELCKK